jgi:hypothetical protein
MSTHIMGCTSTLGQTFSIETLGTTKGDMRRIKRLFEASDQIGLTATRIARAANCTIQDAMCLIETLASAGAVKPRRNASSTYAINPHYTGNIWSASLA